MNDFLATDHLISLDDIVKIINQEIQWCYANPMKDLITQDFHDGFIGGLEQAKHLIIEMTKSEYK